MRGCYVGARADDRAESSWEVINREALIVEGVSNRQLLHERESSSSYAA
jgi:hypothetical protein